MLHEIGTVVTIWEIYTFKKKEIIILVTEKPETDVKTEAFDLLYYQVKKNK